MKYELAVFDLDGTILDTLTDLYHSVNFALEKNQYPPRTRDEVRRFVGDGIPKLIERACPSTCTGIQRSKVYSDFTDYYAEHYAVATSPYPGIHTLLRDLQKSGMIIAVVSNKDDYAVKLLCRDYFDNMFDQAQGACVHLKKKPAPDMVWAVLQKLQISPKKAVYIGDSDVDILTAKNAGLDCISVTWGFRDVDFLEECGATRIVSSMKELKKLLL